MQKTKAMPTESRWRNPYLYTKEEQEKILSVLRRANPKKFPNNPESQEHEREIIESVKRATDLLNASQHKDWPTIEHFTQEELIDLKKAHTRYITILSKINPVTAIPLSVKLEEMVVFKDSLYVEAKRLGLTRHEEILDLPDMIRHVLNLNECVLNFVKLLASENKAHRPKNEIMHSTVFQLWTTFSRITGNQQIGEKGSLEDFIHAAVEPIDKHNATSIRAILREMKIIHKALLHESTEN